MLGKLNDTGITACGNESSNDFACPKYSYPGQDAELGRDATHNDDSDGHAGFSFTKISSTGAVLPASASSWSCVQDNVTGLMWEVKTDDNSLHDKDWTYTWYESDNTKNGGTTGKQNGGSCSHTSICDTSGYVQAVNAAGWCGKKDWRMPRRGELRGIVALGYPDRRIDVDYFPNTVESLFWSSSPDARSDGSGGPVGINTAWSVGFGDGGSISKNGSLQVRLVRIGQ
ncbi:MAG: DUF1566 domain-containing protein [Methylococcaceae bacterium]